MMILWLIAQGSGSAPSTNVAPDLVIPLITGGAVVLGALISGVVSSVTIHFTNRHLLDGGDDVGPAFNALLGSTILYFRNTQLISLSVQDRSKDAEHVYNDFEKLKNLLARHLSLAEIKSLQPGENKEHTPTI
jgi:hypothetical protein